MALMLEPADLLGDDRWAHPELFCHILAHLTADEHLVNDVESLLLRQRPPLPAPVPRHGRRVLLEVPEVGVLQVLLTLEVASVHLLRQHRDVVDVLRQEEGILPMLLQRHVSEVRPDLGEPHADGLQPLRLDDVVLNLHPGMLLGEHLRVEVRLPGILIARLMLLESGVGQLEVRRHSW